MKSQVKKELQKNYLAWTDAFSRSTVFWDTQKNRLEESPKRPPAGRKDKETVLRSPSRVKRRDSADVYE